MAFISDLWLNTSMHNFLKIFFSLFLPRDEIDNPHKKRAQKAFRENFSVQMFFENATEEKVSGNQKSKLTIRICLCIQKTLKLFILFNREHIMCSPLFYGLYSMSLSYVGRDDIFLYPPHT